MRISTLMAHQVAVRNMTHQEGKMLQTMQQVSSGRRVLTPAADPLAAALAVNVAQTESMNARYAENREIARQNLLAQEQTLDGVAGMLQDVLVRLIEAGNLAAYSDAERRMLANVLGEMRQTLLGHANATDGTGQYLFSGDHGKVQPYSKSGQLNLLATQGERKIQVTQTREMPTASTASQVFHQAALGANDYLIEAATGNQGSITFSRLEIIAPAVGIPPGGLRVSFIASGDPAQPWEIAFANSNGDPVPGLPPQPYVSGDDVEFAGIRIAFAGEPVAGDVFTVQAAELDLFADLERVITTLMRPIEADAAAAAMLQNDLATANRKVNLLLDNVLTVRASIGARLNELDALDAEGAHRALMYGTQLSSLEDIDYRQASSDLAVRTMALQAAELAYMKVQNLGLFSR